MSEVPDKVISDAVKAVPATQAGVGSARMVRQIVVPAAPVIAAWAREQERDRIMQQAHSRHELEPDAAGKGQK